MAERSSRDKSTPKTTTTKRTVRGERDSHAQRLETLGTLAAGIAHEIRNPLGVLAISLDSIARTNGDDPHVTEALGHARASVARIDRIVTTTLNIAREQDTARELIDLSPIVSETVQFVGATLKGKSVEFNVAFESNPLPPLSGNRGQLQQALLNLLLNAVDSIALSGSVSVVVRKHPAKRASSIILEISDTGSGIAKDDQRDIFRAYFTRKPGGTGLGLSITRAIIDNHNADIQFHSKPGSGTTFTITFPVATLPS